MAADDDLTVENDPDRTILVPRPGGQGRRAAAATTTRPAGLELQRMVAGLNPLLGAANLLLSLVPRLRATTQHADPAALQRQLLVRVHEFETRARAVGVPRPKISAARYVLCCFLDEVISGTPWGANGAWTEHSLLGAFHEERWGGDKAFQLLERLGDDVPGHRDVLELYCVCLALGFEGRYHGVANGRAQLQAIRSRLHELLRPAAADAPPAGGLRSLSPSWQPAAVPGRSRLAMLPLWLPPALGGVLVLAVVLALHARLTSLSQPVFEQLHDAAATLRVPIPAATAAAAARPRLAPLLQAELGAGATLQEDALQSRLSLPAEGLFAAGSAELVPAQRERLVRIGRALAAQPGTVLVTGHTDERSRASLQFPSNWELSRAWAQAVGQALGAGGVTAERLHAEGRAGTEPPAAAGDTAAAPPARRIEITLRLPRPEAP